MKNVELDIIRRAEDAVAEVQAVHKMFGQQADTRRVGFLAASSGCVAGTILPQLYAALTHNHDARYSVTLGVPVPFPLLSLGKDNGSGGIFGHDIGLILGININSSFNPDKFPLNYPSQYLRADEDTTVQAYEQLLFGTQPGFSNFPGYGPGLTEEPNGNNRTPANLINFQHLRAKTPGMFIAVPNGNHIDSGGEITDPFILLFTSDPIQDSVFPPPATYTRLTPSQWRQILMYYHAPWFDYTLKCDKEALKNLKQNPFINITADTPSKSITVMNHALNFGICDDQGDHKH